MLQFLTAESDRYSAAEQAQMMIEGGCTWIQVTRPDEGMTMRETIESVKQLCEENEAFLMVDHDVDLANEMRIHGVHLAKGDMAPAKARELLGPHAVIGVDVETADEILQLGPLDIDYAVLAPFGKNLLFDDYKRIIDDANARGNKMPVVARGEIAIEDLRPLRQAGVSGVALSRTLVDAADPVEACRKALDELQL